MLELSFCPNLKSDWGKIQAYFVVPGVLRPIPENPSNLSLGGFPTIICNCIPVFCGKIQLLPESFSNPS